MKKENYFLARIDGNAPFIDSGYLNRCSAEHAALYAMNFYDGMDVLSSDCPFYVACYEY